MAVSTVSATVSICQGICAAHRATPCASLSRARRRRRRCCRRHTCRQSSADATLSRYSGHLERASRGMVHCGHARCKSLGADVFRWVICIGFRISAPRPVKGNLGSAVDVTPSLFGDRECEAIPLRRPAPTHPRCQAIGTGARKPEPGRQLRC